MQETPLAQNIRAICSASLEAMGYRVVQVRFMDSKQRRTLQIMAERLDEAMMSVDDCAQISHTVSALLDVEDPISDAYQLEVSSPGIDRPLMSREDFTRHLGHTAKVETHLPVDGRKRFKGDIAAAEADAAVLAMEDGTQARIPWECVASAKLMMTDALVREHLSRHNREKRKKIGKKGE